MADQQDTIKPDAPKRGRLFWRILVCVLSVPTTGWAALAIYYSNLPGVGLRGLCSAIFVIIALSIPFRTKSFRESVRRYAICFLLVLLWWCLIPPSNDRDWQADVAVLPYAEISGETMTIHNIRNFDYTSPTDYTPAYYDKTVRLDQLQTADLFLVYWGSDLIAHTIMSFGFGDGSYVAISIETRKEKTEAYSAVKGFFKQYELTYVVADERDVVRLRTNYRKEDAYLYRLKADPDLVRSVFLDYFKVINDLVENPKWYNALTQNCTTTIRGHAKPYNPETKFDWRMLANGRIDEMGYERGAITNQLPFEELKKRSLINSYAQALDQDPEFSRKIREKVFPEESETAP